MTSRKKVRGVGSNWPIVGPNAGLMLGPVLWPTAAGPMLAQCWPNAGPMLLGPMLWPNAAGPNVVANVFHVDPYGLIGLALGWPFAGQ